MKPDQVPPGMVAEPTEYVAPSKAETEPEGDVVKIAWASDGSKPSPLLNLLKPAELPPVAVAVPAGDEKLAPPPSHRLARYLAASGLVTAIAAAGVYVVFAHQAIHKPMAQVASPTPIPSIMPTVTPVPATPTATPVPTPTPTPVALTVTAPAVAPTPSHPQSITVMSKSGLWLRSSATSVNRNNIISWMPDGAQVSVDQVGDFWWHGVFKGVTGFFASKYTQ